ncbi:MAG: hypothetical protein EXR07_14805 [Acetobacteraceae bacterium]|nr:hypothetical protein [Acetobacteraceae bacterium]
MLLLCLALLASPATAWAAIASFDLGNDLPPVIEDTTKAANCTVTYLVTDITTNDTIAVRMRMTSAPNDRPENGVMPCPRDIPPRVAARALEACGVRAADRKTCVFADMARDFISRPTVNSTAENTSRCASDQATDIGIACGTSGDAQICGVACGIGPEAAAAAAMTRCEAKHLTQCKLTGSLPVLAPR